MEGVSSVLGLSPAANVPPPPFSVHQYAEASDLKSGLPFKVMLLNGQMDIKQHNMSADIVISHSSHTPRSMSSTQVVRELEYILGADSHGCQVHINLSFAELSLFGWFQG